MADPALTVVIPNRDGAALLPEVLDGLSAQTFRDFQVVVADDASTDDSRQVCDRHPLSPRFVPVRDGPRGFGAAANTGLRHAPGSEWVALLNNDAVPDPGWLAALVEALTARPQFRFAASRVRFLYSPDLLESAGDGLAACGQPFRRGHRSSHQAAFDRPVEVLSASASAALFRRSLLLELGGFDEDFFAVYEDVDLGIRAYSRGHRGLYVPTATVRHRGSATLGRGERARYLDLRNREWLLFKHLPLRTFLAAFPWYLVHQAYSALGALRRGEFGLFARAKAEALWGLPGWIGKRNREFAERRIDRARFEAALDWTWAARHARAVLEGTRAEDDFEFGAVLPER